MMIKPSFLTLGLLTTVAINLFSMPSYAGETDYIFIENNIDNEYFIAPPTRSKPRFSGANILTKYPVGQKSLGYLGPSEKSDSSFAKKGEYMDIWLKDSPIDSPFIGSRCMQSSGCPNDFTLHAERIKSDGSYKSYLYTNDGQALYARGVLSMSAYQFFRKLPVGNTTTLNYNACSTKIDYDVNTQSCESVGGNYHIKNDMISLTKTGHLTLKSTNALQEIFVDSNGNAVLGLGSKLCESAVVKKEQGIMCALVAYNFEGSLTGNNMDIALKLNPLIDGLKSKSSLYIGDGKNVWNSGGTSIIDIDKIVYNGDGDIYLFMGQAFLKEVITKKIDLAKSQELFTFFVDNTKLSQSGYYEFTPSNTLIIKPRDYGVSIVSKEMINNPYREGKVGDKEPPLTFDYIVTTSAFRQANKITAAVEGPQITLKGQPYCLFSSKDKKINVPFSAYLTYTDESGSKVKTRTACDNVPISIKEALWTQTTWPYPYQLEGYFYRTDLQLTFPMNEGTSLFSMEGEDWIGVVEASGYVNVFAEWSGTDIY
ncbi:fimbrial protein [Proteus sp. NMG38-2]|uniref:fimbrial protein n=1 Tax=Proteus sp. NMG38-2 TaxID=2883107 RepID=UPI001D0B0BAB|nr:fimbrial protein [Proteus sp. NMG38-2]UDN35543.1 fimbrial protein [Proteus sp. NMG38-2]